MMEITFMLIQINLTIKGDKRIPYRGKSSIVMGIHKWTYNIQKLRHNVWWDRVTGNKINQVNKMSAFV